MDMPAYASRVSPSSNEAHAKLANQHREVVRNENWHCRGMVSSSSLANPDKDLRRACETSQEPGIGLIARV
jgi:hypothetical protein